MMMQRERVRVDSLKGGDLVRQTRLGEPGQPGDSRTVVISSVLPDVVVYHGVEHLVTRVVGIDPEKGKKVMWMAVPDQHVTVVR